MKKLCCLLLAFVFLAGIQVLFADTVTLKSGQVIEGKIVERTADVVKVDFMGVEMAYFMDDIAEINSEEVAAGTAEKAGASAQAVEKIAAAQEVAQNEAPSDPAVRVKEEIAVERQVEAVPSGREPAATLDDRQVKTAAIAAIGGIIAIIFLATLIYVYSSLCLYFIARKTGNEPAWLAWVPIGNLFLMCKIAGQSYWLLLIFLASFLPIIGGLVNLGLFGFFWFKIAEARGKPGWMGILCVLPLVNLVMMGVIAFSE